MGSELDDYGRSDSEFEELEIKLEAERARAEDAISKAKGFLGELAVVKKERNGYIDQLNALSDSGTEPDPRDARIARLEEILQEILDTRGTMDPPGWMDLVIDKAEKVLAGSAGEAARNEGGEGRKS